MTSDDSRGCAWIVWPAPELETVIRPNDWNELRMSVIGNRYISHLNGVLMVDFTDPAPRSSVGSPGTELEFAL